MWLSKAGIFLCPKTQRQESEKEANHLPCLDLTFPFAQLEAWVHMTDLQAPSPAFCWNTLSSLCWLSMPLASSPLCFLKWC